MEKIFNALIDTFILNKVGIVNDFLNETLSSHLKENLKTLFAERKLHAAGTGLQSIIAHDDMYRTDMIYWLDRDHNDIHENSFFDIMDEFIILLNETCYTGITGYEFHYTLYEAGSYYRRHLDQFRNNDSRQFSMIMYLNSEWEQSHGGELRIFHKECIEDISPISGRSVFFKSSELEHEVLVSNKQRMSITGWLKS